MSTLTLEASVLKRCCAALYESEWARLLLGETFHPGGLALTARLGALLALEARSRVLDVASGRGDSAIFLAQQFGCEVVGIDYSAQNVTVGRIAAERASVSERVCFEQADAEQLPFDADTFDAIVCECAFCTFPTKVAAAAEFARVLRPGGRAGLSDLTRRGELPPELDTLFGWISCIADAQPLERYAEYMQRAGLRVQAIEPHDAALAALVDEIRGKLMGAQVLTKLGKIDFPLADFSQAQRIARVAAQSIRDGKLGYTLMVANKVEGLGANAQ